LFGSHLAQEGSGAGAIGEGTEDSQRVVAMNSNAGWEAVEVDSHTLELGQQLLESSLVSHRSRLSRHRPHALATTALG
jgi:hypothetical protein